MKQGSYGIAVRNPVYLNDEHGQAYFWGFTIVILRVPDIFSDSIHALSGFRYEYRLSKTETPWSDTYKTVYQSDGQITQPVSYDFTIGKESWKFELTPESGWQDNLLIAKASIIFTAITLLLSGLIRVWLVSNENKNKFQILARTDSLTGIYNRYGFDESAEKMMDKNPKAHFVAALLDIDDFKFINDIYGHAYGDKALKSLADSMKTFFHLMHYWEETAGMNSVFFYKIIPVKMQKNCCSNLPDFQRHSHTREKNSHLTFLWDMRNIPHLQPAVHSLCAVQMQPFMK